jgi:curved DNA-binding protein
VESARDFYKVLGVARGAQAGEIKRAFRSKARMLHPDVSADPAAERKFRELAEAYAVLSRPASRMLYDRFGYRGRGVWAAPPASAHAFTSLLELWARATRRPKPVGAVGYIELGFYEAMRGGRRLVRYTSRNEGAKTCGVCSDRHGEEREVLLSVPPGSEDGDQIAIEGDSGAFVLLRVSPPPPDSTLVRAAALVGLLAALGFLTFLFLG